MVVITGASSGIGEATALAFAREGSRVVLAARRIERLESLATGIRDRGGQAIAVGCDVTEPEQLGSLPNVVKEAFGPADVLINNAGIPGRGPFVKLSDRDIEDVVRVNVLGVMLATRAFLPEIISRGRGHVVNVASLAGRYAWPGATVYSATKHAVVAFSEALNYEVERSGVRVTAVNPGFVATEGFPQGHLPDRFVMKLDRVPAAILKVVRQDIAPEYSVPRWIAPFQAFRILTPPLYRWGVRTARNVASRRG